MKYRYSGTLNNFYPLDFFGGTVYIKQIQIQEDSMKKYINPLCILFLLLLLSTPLYSFQLILDKSIAEKMPSYCYGDIAKDHIEIITRFDRNPMTEGYHKAAEFVAEKAKEYGLEEVKIERFPWDGTVKYFTYETAETWQPIKGELRIISPQYELLANYDSQPVNLAQHSKPADVTADLVYIESPLRASTYKKEDVEGKVVLTGADLAAAAQMLINGKGALGVVSFNLLPFWDESRKPWDFKKQVGYCSIPQSANGFGFGLSYDEGNKLKERLLRREKIKVRVKVEAEYKPMDTEVVSALIRGTELPEEEIIIISHLCHGKPGANDNASGSAANLETAHTILSMINDGIMGKPRRTIRFLWVAEYAGTAAWLSTHLDDPVKRIAVINLDMVGENQKLTDSRVNITRSPNSCPSYFTTLIENAHKVIYENNQIRHTNSPYKIHSFSGSQNPWNAIVHPYSFGSDHDVFLDATINVPSTMYGNWPDNFYHSSEDTPDKVDATQLSRVIFFTSALSSTIAYADDKCAEKILYATVGKAHKSIGNYFKKACDLLISVDASGLFKAYYDGEMTIEYGVENEIQAIKSVSSLSKELNDFSPYEKQLNALKDNLKQQLKTIYRQKCASLGIPPDAYRLTTEETEASKIVPVRTKESRGSINVFNLQGAIRDPQQMAKFGKILNWYMGQGNILLSFGILSEVINFADGKRNLLTIRNEVTAEYYPIPLWSVTDIYEVLEFVGYIELKK